MSREVRRVPVGWWHPTEPNPYWREQTASALVRRDVLSQLHLPQLRFVGLVDGFEERLAEWQQEVAELEQRKGHDWAFGVEYHLTGFLGRDDTEPVVHPFYDYGEDGAERPVAVRNEDHLHELLIAQKSGERPDPADYMPTFDEPLNELGWALYETVSEGTPVTPVFATAADLVEHLVTVGQDWDQVPMRPAAAEALVRDGGSLGSMVAVGGQLLQSDTEADRIPELLREAGR